MKHKIKVFQIVRTAFNSSGFLLPKEKRTTKVVCIGNVITPNIKPNSEPLYIEEEIWNLFNWTCWGGQNRHKSYIKAIRKGFRYRGFRVFPNSNARGYCNGDIFFKLDGVWRVALSHGWKFAYSYEEALKICIESQRW